MDEVYLNENLRLRFLSIHNYANFSSIVLDMEDDADNSKPFSIISKQDGIDILEVGNLFSHIGSSLLANRPVLDDRSMTSVKLSYHAYGNSPVGTLPANEPRSSALSEKLYDKLEYKLELSRHGVELEHLLVGGKSMFYNITSRDTPSRTDLLSKFIYMSLMQEIPDLTQNIRDLYPSIEEGDKLLAYLNRILVEKINYIDKPLVWSNENSEILYWDIQHEGYLSLSEAPISIQSLVYTVIVGLNAILNDLILVIDDFVGLPSSAKVICLAIFKTFIDSTGSTSHIIVIDGEDYQAYKENVLTSGRVFKTLKAENGSFYITNKQLI